jgi:hypothetical protein
VLRPAAGETSGRLAHRRSRETHSATQLPGSEDDLYVGHHFLVERKPFLAWWVVPDR